MQLPRGSILLNFEAIDQHYLISSTASVFLHFLLTDLAGDCWCLVITGPIMRKNIILVTAGRSSVWRSCNKSDSKVESFCTCALITQYCHDNIVFPPSCRIGGYINYCINCLIIEAYFVRAAAALKSNILENNRWKITLIRNYTFWIRIVLQLESKNFRVLNRELYLIPILFSTCYSSALTACTYCTYKIILSKCCSFCSGTEKCALQLGSCKT